MQLKFRTRQMLGFALVVGVMGSVTTWAGFSFLSKTIFKEAQLRVEMDINSAWAAYREEVAQLESAVSMSAQRASLHRGVQNRLNNQMLSTELEVVRTRFGLDFLTLVRSDSVIVARSRTPYLSGDTMLIDPVLAEAFQGRIGSGTVVVSEAFLHREGDALVALAHIPLVETERAVPRHQLVENRGLVLMAAVPILDTGENVIGVVYGGILLNRKFELVDRIREAVFGDMTYEGSPVGTVTIFLWDVRIATNVMQLDKTRALGTRVSEEVYHTVLEKGKRFADRAFVVNDWYLSAYDPIRDPTGQIVGIIYVGLLEKKYLAYRSSLATQFLGISFASLLLSAVVAFYLSSTLRRPIQQLVTAARELSAGNLKTRVNISRASQETSELAAAFNSMAASLGKRNQELEQTTLETNKAYLEADEKNRAYLEMLGFVTHELKSPLASIVFAIESVRDGILGPITSPQEAVLKSAANSADYLHNTIANYLNLSRIEEGALKLELSEAAFASDIIRPVLERLTETAADQQMTIEVDVPPAYRGWCDTGLLTAVFQNLLSNAIKYGRTGGKIKIACSQAAEGFTFSVFNEGRGFSPQVADQLFAKFFRWTDKEQDTRSGTGLGLFVTRRIIELHGGQIWAESEEGHWAKFTFTLPQATVNE
jgi:two-component system NtrC family sensor kinase